MGGKIVLMEKRETIGSPETIRLTTGRVEIDVDGEDIAVLRVEVLDKQGRLVPTANALINFKVTGHGALLGVGNGDPNCHESGKEPRRSLFNGLAQVIVQSAKNSGNIVVETYMEAWPGPKIPGMTVTIATRKVDLRPSL